jgi:hypothetical protein
MPIFIAVDIWLGFQDGWQTADYVQIGVVLLSGIAGWMMYSKIDCKKN